ncbi:MAG: hypothetical protein GF370_02600 [Candidatus Nealsonbacteria bacterium]|nr:hypothetical protein [Candidatus Nealsonbacteria bacterium]
MFWNYILLGFLQGVFEWLPVSSEGVVALASQFLLGGGFNPLDIALFLHFGTLLAVIIYFWKDWQEVLSFKNLEMLRFLLISTLLSLVVAYPLYILLKERVVIGNMLLLVMGIGLLFTSYFHKKKLSPQIGFGDKLALIGGFLQGLSVIPGLSRSGSTIFGLSMGKLEPPRVLKVSYMMSVPVVLASSFYLILQNEAMIISAWPALASSFLAGMISLHFLLKLAQRVSFFKFTFSFGVLCLVGALLNFII